MLYFIIGIIGGIAGGMGMGGGTLLIPLLTFFVSSDIKQSQFLNIFSFLIMAIFIAFVYIKNKEIDFFSTFIFGLFASVISFCSSLLSKNIDSGILKICFGVFLIIFGIIELIKFIISNKEGQKLD